MNNGNTPIGGRCPSDSDSAWAAARVDGLTKREYFAGLAMASLISGVNALMISGDYHGWNPKDFAEEAVIQSDTLLKELEK